MVSDGSYHFPQNPRPLRLHQQLCPLARMPRVSCATCTATGTMVFSAGTEPTEVNPLAIRAMSERGVDISGQRSKSLNEFQGTEFDLVVTISRPGEGGLPLLPRRREEGPSELSRSRGRRRDRGGAASGLPGRQRYDRGLDRGEPGLRRASRGRAKKGEKGRKRAKKGEKCAR